MYTAPPRVRLHMSSLFVPNYGLKPVPVIRDSRLFQDSV
jgi:hypothetical protein